MCEYLPSTLFFLNYCCCCVMSRLLGSVSEGFVSCFVYSVCFISLYDRGRRFENMMVGWDGVLSL